MNRRKATKTLTTGDKMTAKIGTTPGGRQYSTKRIDMQNGKSVQHTVVGKQIHGVPQTAGLGQYEKLTDASNKVTKRVNTIGNKAPKADHEGVYAKRPSYAPAKRNSKVVGRGPKKAAK